MVNHLWTLVFTQVNRKDYKYLLMLGCQVSSNLTWFTEIQKVQKWQPYIYSYCGVNQITLGLICSVFVYICCDVVWEDLVQDGLKSLYLLYYLTCVRIENEFLIFNIARKIIFWLRYGGYKRYTFYKAIKKLSIDITCKTNLLTCY